MKSKSKIETEKITNSAQNFLKDYCINFCNGNCCKNGFLNIKPSEAKRLFGKNKERIIRKNKELFVVSTHPTCIYLDKYNKCKIYKNRPNICKEYPIKLIKGNPNIIIFHPSCKAVKDGSLNSHIKSLRNLGNIVMT